MFQLCCSCPSPEFLAFRGSLVCSSDCELWEIELSCKLIHTCKTYGMGCRRILRQDCHSGGWGISGSFFSVILCAGALDAADDFDIWVRGFRSWVGLAGCCLLGICSQEKCCIITRCTRWRKWQCEAKYYPCSQQVQWLGIPDLFWERWYQEIKRRTFKSCQAQVLPLWDQGCYLGLFCKIML